MRGGVAEAMGEPDRSEQVTRILADAENVPAAEVAQRLLPLVYDEMRELAGRYLAGERAGHTLQPTALVHETYLRLMGQSRVGWQGRSHILAVGAAMMRRILIDHARAQKRLKRGGGARPVSLHDGLIGTESQTVDVTELHHALERLATLDPRQAQIVELRFFGGLTVQEVAEYLGVSKRLVEGEWTHAKAWLHAQLTSSEP